MADGTIAQKPLASAQAGAPARSSMALLMRRKSTIAFIMTIVLVIISVLLYRQIRKVNIE